jgi:Kef-type K+ transport system membrane component KefB
MEWVILVSGVLIWMLLMFFMVYFLVNKYLRREKVI